MYGTIRLTLETSRVKPLKLLAHSQSSVVLPITCCDLLLTTASCKLLTFPLLMTSDHNSAMGEVIPDLWVGNLMSVSRILQLQHERRSDKEIYLTIISVLSNSNLIRLVTDVLEKHHLKHSATIRVRHEMIELKDLAETDLLAVLPDALMLIDDALGCHQTARSSGNNVSTKICLVHCARGASRSVSIVIAYLLSRHGSRFKSFDDALQHVRRVRPVAEPNIGFSLALKRYERTLRTLHEET